MVGVSSGGRVVEPGGVVDKVGEFGVDGVDPVVGLVGGVLPGPDGVGVGAFGRGRRTAPDGGPSG